MIIASFPLSNFMFIASFPLSNLKLKIISKILDDRLATYMPSLISLEKKCFIHGRSIKDCICLAYEAMNHLDNKAFDGNLIIKVDIIKAFDTVDWSFLVRVLKSFGFNSVFWSWIHCILSFACMSVSLNGGHYSFFNCSRGCGKGSLFPSLVMSWPRSFKPMPFKIGWRWFS